MPENLNELFAELKATVYDHTNPGSYAYSDALEFLYRIDLIINNGEFARAEQDAYIG